MIEQKIKKFGTMRGVFTPTFLTILGVIMYLRLSWVVGNAGVLGALGIIAISVIITVSTALSLSTITTNIRIGSGGAFSLISQSLGLEIGGAIGFPFFFSQAIAATMYIFGFREGINAIFPDLNQMMLDVMVFVVIMTIAFISTSFAFKIQYIIMSIVIASLVSIFGSLFTNEINLNLEWIGEFPGSIDNQFKGSSFWIVFAVFFPAVTGIMAGANMSGDLKNPKKSIPLGTLSAVALSALIYISLVFVAALIATPYELTRNYYVLIEKSWFPPIVLAGLLGATLSQALNCFVGAPRILLALGEKNILPKSGFISRSNKRGEPFNAMIVTAVIVFFALFLRDLNTIAPLITMFFMITYGMVNVVALIEQSLGLPSFRPTLKITIFIPLIGAVGCLTVMFIINALVALLALIFIVIFYFYLVRKNLSSEAGDSRSGLFTALAEWSTKKTTDLSSKRELRSWRPDFLVPIVSPKDVRSSLRLIESLAAPKGSVKFLALKNKNKLEQQILYRFLIDVTRRLRNKNLSTSFGFISGNSISETLFTAMEALNLAFFKPNTLFLTIDNSKSNEEFTAIIESATNTGYGVVVYVPFESIGLSLEKEVNLFISKLPVNWNKNYNLGNNDLSILLSILLTKNWRGNLCTYISNAYINSEEDLHLIKDMVRFPENSTIKVYDEEDEDDVINNSIADLNIFPANTSITIETMIYNSEISKTSLLYCYDSGNENSIV